jgi:rod shape determining protein RodA
LGLVFIPRYIGPTTVLSAILVGTLRVAGARPRHLGVLALTAVVLLFGAFQLGVVKDYQVQRLAAFLDAKNDPQGAGYNRSQSEIGIGSGGLTGAGYLHGTQTNLDFIPEQHTDFIFTVVGEEFGFVGAMMLLVLFGILIWRAFRIALLSKDPFGSYVAAGIGSMFAIQMFVNIGMTVGIMPITGIPLPFVSYGGSSLLANFLAVGLLLNIHMRRFK